MRLRRPTPPRPSLCPLPAPRPLVAADRARTLRQRALLVTILAACALVLATPALAGGWAVSTLDEVLYEAQAGQEYRVGYTIRQHGEQPFVGAATGIRIRSTSTAETHDFRAAPDGPPGHYVAVVRFPSAGAWAWEVDQTPFAPQSLGTLTVRPAYRSAVPPAGEPALLPAALALGAATASALLAVALVSAARPRTGAARPPHSTGPLPAAQQPGRVVPVEAGAAPALGR